MSRLSNHIPFDKFITFLKAHGFQIGVDTHLKLNQLLNSLEGDFNPDRIKYLLCPLFASRNEEQERFYDLYDKFFQEEVIVEKTLSTENKEPISKQRIRNRKWLIYGVGLLLTVFVALFWRVQNCSCNDWSYQSVKDCLFETCPSTATLNVDSSRTIISDTSTTHVSDVSNIHSSIDIPEFNFEKKDLQEENVTRFEVSEAFRGTSWSRALVAGVFVGFVTIGYLFAKQRKNKRKQILQNDALKKPPYNYNLKVDIDDLKLFSSKEFYDTAKVIKKRLEGHHKILDVDKSIFATIQSAGFPTFVHATNTRQPEYLILIERLSEEDCLYHYYKQLIHEFEAQEIFIQAYYFKNDFRTVFHIDTDKPASFDEIEIKYHERRLLVIADSDKLIDLKSGEIDKYTLDAFSTWTDVGILSTKNPQLWGYTELKLHQFYPVVPATLDGLSSIIDQFENDIKINPGLWIGASRDRFELNFDAPKITGQLATNLTEKNFQLLCATMAYPEISWGLTMKLAEFLSITYGPYSEKDILKILNLTWFRDGHIPEETRLELLNQIKNEMDIHKYIVKLMEGDEPTQNSYAHDQYETRLLIQKLHLAISAKDKSEIYSRLEELSGSGEINNPILKRFVNDDYKTKFKFLVSNHLRQSNPIAAAKTNRRRIRNITITSLLIVGFFLLPGAEGSMPFGTSMRKVISPQTTSDSAHFYNFNGITKYIKEDYNSATLDFQKAIDLDTNFIPAYFNRIEAISAQGFQDSVKRYTNQLENLYDNEKVMQAYIDGYEVDSVQIYDLVERLLFNRAIDFYRIEEYEEALDWLEDYDEFVRLQKEDMSPSDEYFIDILVLKVLLKRYKKGDEIQEKLNGIAVEKLDNVLAHLKKHPSEIIDQGSLRLLLKNLDLYASNKAKLKIRELLMELQATIDSYNIDNLILKIQLPLDVTDQLIPSLEKWIKVNDSKVTWKKVNISNVRHSEVIFLKFNKKTKKDTVQVVASLLSSVGESRKIVFVKDSTINKNVFVIDITIQDNFKPVDYPQFIEGDWYQKSDELIWSYRITKDYIDPDNKEHIIKDISLNKASGIYRLICKVEGEFDVFYIVKNGKLLTISWNGKRYTSIDKVKELDEIKDGKSYSNLNDGVITTSTELPMFLEGNWYNEEGTWLWGIRSTSIQHGNKMYTLRKVLKTGGLYKVILTNSGEYYVFVFNKLTSNAMQANWGHGPYETEQKAINQTWFGALPKYSKSSADQSTQKGY